jgi:multicomponent Na+:H+ antiporter subunit C
MEIVLGAVVGLMFACGTYMILRPSLIRIVLGFGLYSNAVNVLLILCGGYRPSWEAPFVGITPGATLMDPLPPDIILTAIVISFAVGSLLLTLCYCVYLDHGTDDPEELPSKSAS